MRRRTIAVALALSFLTSWAATASPPPLQPRTPAAKTTQRPLPADTAIARVVLKFREGSLVRLRDKQLTAVDNGVADAARLARSGLAAATVQQDVEKAQQIIARSTVARGVGRLFTADEVALSARRVAGEQRGGKELADLDLYFEVSVPEGSTSRSVKPLVDQLNALPSVEIAYAEPVPEIAAADIPPTTPSFVAQQGYLGSPPLGIGASANWGLSGGRGQGVKIVDIEYGWRVDHEDLPAFFHGGGDRCDSDVNSSLCLAVENHGTAVMGEMVGVDNAYGVTGIANQAQAGWESVLSQSTASAIANAALVADVVLIELHQRGPANGTPCTCNTSQCDFIAMEYWQANFDAISTATANGVVVVEPAGNGSSDLDDPAYAGAFDRTVRDSGAILVGASEADGATPACFTNFGSRVDLHGWGEGVTSTGFGYLFNGNGDRNQYYTDVFNGTSSASPIVTGAAAVLAGVARASFLPFSPTIARNALVASGTPQGNPTSKHIGPLPNLSGAIPLLYDDRPTAFFTSSCAGRTCSFDSSGSSDDHGITSRAWAFGDGGTATGTVAVHTYATSGTFQVSLTVTDTAGQLDSAYQNLLIDLPPTATFVASCSGLFCQLNASASSDDLGISSYRWTFTPGSTASTPNPIYNKTFSTAGTYLVTLTVFDTHGQSASTQQSITVSGNGLAFDTVGWGKDNDKSDFRLRLYHETGSGQITAGINGVTNGQAIAGDWNGDGVDSIGNYVVSTATFYLRNTNSKGASDLTFVFGTPGANRRAVAGDWNGDGVDTIALYEPATGTFTLRNSNSAGAADVTFTFTGADPSWLPISGDWNCDGNDSAGLYDPATGTFYLRNSNSTGSADLSFVFGSINSGNQPVAGDWNNDGWDSIGVWDPLTGLVSLRDLNSAGAADHQFAFANQGKMLAGDWDGI